MCLLHKFKKTQKHVVGPYIKMLICILKIIFAPYSKRAVRILCSSLLREDFCYQVESKSCLHVIFFLDLVFGNLSSQGKKLLLGNKTDVCFQEKRGVCNGPKAMKDDKVKILSLKEIGTHDSIVFSILRKGGRPRGCGCK